MTPRERAEEVADRIRYITDDGSGRDPIADAIEREIIEAVAEERESCARIIETFPSAHPPDSALRRVAPVIAECIRARRK